MNICLIPARSKSKRIKNKNIKLFFGKPLIYFAIDKAKKSNLFDRIIVSTDSKKISQISKSYGAEVPFLRPKQYSNDYATDKEVRDHFVEYCKENNIYFKNLCYLYPINPLLKVKTLVNCYKLLLKKKIDGTITISKFCNPIQRSFYINKKNILKIYDKNKYNKRSQDLIDFYHDAAQCYWFRYAALLKPKNKELNIHGYVLNKFEYCDVDTMEDLKLLKMIYQNKLQLKY
jgi:pseudaminic acid cytidylyltransferase